MSGNPDPDSTGKTQTPGEGGEHVGSHPEDLEQT